MAGWVDRQVDRWIDRRIDRYVDKKLDAFLADQMSDEDFRQLKAMTKKGEPLDAETEDRLRDQLGDAFEPYKQVHNGVARMERLDQSSSSAPTTPRDGCCSSPGSVSSSS